MELAFGLPQAKRNYSFLANQLSLTDQSCKKELLSLAHTGNGNENTGLRVYLQNLQSSKKEAQIYEWRTLTTKSIVKVHLIQPFLSFSSNKMLGYVFTDHIHHSLENIHSLPLQEAIGLLLCLLNGYQSIFRVLGLVSIDLAFCGITTKGQCKVWINSNFSSNQAAGKVLKQQCSIVYQIVRVVRQKSHEDSQSFYIELLRHLDLCGNVTFSELSAYLDDYLKRHQTFIKKLSFFEKQSTNFQFQKQKNYYSQKASALSRIPDSIKVCQGIPTLVKSKDRIKINKFPENYRKRSTISYQQHLQFKTSPQTHLQQKARRQKASQLRITEKTIQTTKTQRKNTQKRNSVLVHPTQHLSEVPRFLTKKLIKSPKYKIKTADNDNLQAQKLQNDNIFNAQTASQSNRFSNIMSNKQNSNLNNQNENKQTWKANYLQDRSMHSLNNILTQITERNQQNQTERGKKSKRLSKNNPRKQQLKVPLKSCNCQFSHQFSISIINEGSDFKSSQGRKFKRSQISTNKTLLDSQKSSPHKYNENLFWDLKRKKDAFNSQMINRQNSQFSYQDNFRRNSGEKGMTIKGFERYSDFLKFNNTLMQQSIENSSFQNQFRDSIRKDENTQRNSVNRNISWKSQDNESMSLFKVRKTQTVETQQKDEFSKDNVLNNQKQKPIFKSTREDRKKLMMEEENENKFKIKAKQQQIINANQWKKMIRNLTGNAQQELKLNMSISYGDQIGNNPIRLQRLANIGREISSSIIPIQQLDYNQHS